MSHFITILFGTPPIQLRHAARLVEVARLAGSRMTCVAPVGVELPCVEHVARFSPSVGIMEGGDAGVAEIHEIIGRLSREGPIGGIFPVTEDHVEVAAQCCEDFDIPGLRPAQALCFRHKPTMMARASALGVRVERGLMPLNIAQLKAFVAEVGFPVVLKPVDGCGGVDTFRLENQEQLEEVWARLGNGARRFRAERFNPGRQYHVDMILSRGKAVFVALSEYLKPLLQPCDAPIVGSVVRSDKWSPAEETMVAECERVSVGLGLATGIVHAEFFIHDGVVTLIEVASRPIGAFGVQLYEASHGIDLVQEWGRCVMSPGHRPTPRWSKVAAAQYIIPPQSGVLSALPDVEALLEREGVVDAVVVRRVGDRLTSKQRHLMENAIGYVIVEGPTKEVALKRLAMAVDGFKYSVKAQGVQSQVELPT